MNMKLALLVLITLMLSWTVVADVSQIKSRVASDSDSILRGFLGDEVKYATVVEVKNKIGVVEQRSSAPEIAYLPRPMMKATRELGDSDYQVTIKVFIFSSLENSSKLKNILQAGLSQYGAVVEIKSVEQAKLPEVAALPSKPGLESGDDVKKPSEPIALEKEKSFQDKILNSPDLLIKGILALSFLVVLFVMGLLLTRSLRYSADKLSESLKQRADKPSASPETHQSNEKKAVSIRKELAIIEEAIQMNPIVFKKIFSTSDPIDVIGFKSLLSVLSPKSQALFKGNLDFKFLTRITSEKGQELQDQEFKLWLRSLNTKVGIEQLNSSGFYEKLLGPTKWAQLKALGSETLRTSALKLKNPTAYLLVLDLLQGQERTELTNLLSSTDWSSILNERHTEPTDVLNVAELLLEDSSSQSEMLDLPPCILQTSISMLRAADFEDEQGLLSTIYGDNQELLQGLYEQFWPIEKLTEVEPSVLKMVFMSLENSEKIKILSVVPQRIQKLLGELIPEGKMKVVIFDSLSSNSQVSEDSRSANKIYVKDFVDDVRKKAQLEKSQNRNISLKIAS